MRINTKKIRNLEPCANRFNNYLAHYADFDGSLEDFIVLDKITYKDKVWVVTRLFTPAQNVKWSILCASKVLDFFEKKYPADKRPRLALEAAELFYHDPSEVNRQAAADAAAYAAYAVANAAADAAAYAAYAVANAIYAADARYTEEEVNLLLMLDCLEGE